MHGFILLKLHRIMGQEGNGQALEIRPLVALVARRFTI
jgi:hypothetical protein